jgi:hypothetical protein
MKLTYWIAENVSEENSSKCYSLRGRTRKAVVAQLQSGDYDRRDFTKPRKIEVAFDDKYDMMFCSMGEGGGWWESRAWNS